MKRPPRQILESVQKRMPTYQNTMHGERKYVSVLFSDLCGYTAMCERLDAEEAQEITRRILREITQIVKKI